MSLKYKADRVVRAGAKFDTLSEQVAEARKEYDKERKQYRKDWLAEFYSKLDAAGRTWCTYCDLLVYKEKTKIAYSFYAKSDNYGPVFPHTATKHRVCPTCAEFVTGTKGQAKEYMFENDDTKGEPNDKVLKQASELLDMPPFMPS